MAKPKRALNVSRVMINMHSFLVRGARSGETAVVSAERFRAVSAYDVGCGSAVVDCVDALRAGMAELARGSGSAERAAGIDADAFDKLGQPAQTVASALRP
ncbi:hypothetical protein [Flavisphingomonas formosensis]|uniref:hypothetical protein n=1 Tax=Flavisphingomonas formosensis TaxID=861534 RepID=UPI0012F9944D|nr:hypothetical protein [Sphingomonas formosensis]